jgi:hypothetical protein
MICARVDACPSLCWTWSMSFLRRGSYCLLVCCRVGHFFNQWELWVVIWSAVARTRRGGFLTASGLRQVWRHAVDQHGALRHVRILDIVVVIGMWAHGVGSPYQAGLTSRASSGAYWRSCGLQPHCKCVMKSTWSRQEDPRRRRALWLHPVGATPRMLLADL